MVRCSSVISLTPAAQLVVVPVVPTPPLHSTKRSAAVWAPAQVARRGGRGEAAGSQGSSDERPASAPSPGAEAALRSHWWQVAFVSRLHKAQSSNTRSSSRNQVRTDRQLWVLSASQLADPAQRWNTASDPAVDGQWLFCAHGYGLGWRLSASLPARRTRRKRLRYGRPIAVRPAATASTTAIVGCRRACRRSDTVLTVFNDAEGHSMMISAQPTTAGEPQFESDLPNVRCQQVIVGGLQGQRCSDTLSRSTITTVVGRAAHLHFHARDALTCALGL